MGSPNKGTTWAMLDSGSDTCLSERNLEERIDLSGKPTGFSFSTVTGKIGARSMELSIVVRNRDGGDSVELPWVWTVEKLPVNYENISNSRDVNKWPHLGDINLRTVGAEDIQLLNQQRCARGLLG